MASYFAAMAHLAPADPPRPGGEFLSANARYAAYAARALGYAFTSLDGDDGYLFEVRDGARTALFAAGAGSPYALNDARAASLAKDKSFCAAALERAGLPTVPGRFFFCTERYAEMRHPGREPEDARAYARTIAYPIFCKPIAGSNGLYAEVIHDADAFDDYLTRVSREHFAILIQPFLRGAEHRVFVLEGRALFAYRKRLPRVIGDGRSTLRALIDALSRETIVSISAGRDSAGNVIRLDDVPPLGASIDLEGPANRAAGGGADAPVDDIPPALAQLGEAAARVVGLGLAGVDMFDLSAANDFSDLRVIEVNSNPMIKTLEDHGRWDLITTIWRANFAAALR